MVHAAQNAVVYGVYGPTAPPIATCMIFDGENDDEAISTHFKVPYIPMTQSLVTHQDAPLGPDVRHARHLQADPTGLPGLANVQTDPLVQVYMGQNVMSLT